MHAHGSGVGSHEKIVEDMVPHGTCRRQTGRRGFMSKKEGMQAGVHWVQLLQGVRSSKGRNF